MTTAKQRELFDAPPTNGFRDSAFARNKELPIHRWVPWIAGFSAEFVNDCLATYLPKQTETAWVLDPFAGVGTTLVEAYIHGLNAVGFEINPYAALASKMKLRAATISLARFEDYIERFLRFMEQCGSKREPHSLPPDGFSGRTNLFSPRVERKMLFVLDFIQSIDDQDIKNLFRLALGAVMISVSNYSYEPSLTKRTSVNKVPIDDAPVANVVAAKLRQMQEDIGWLKARMRPVGRLPHSHMLPKSVFSAAEHLKQPRHVDLAVTSPPYLNNYHYPRNTRPQLHWLGFTSGPGYRQVGEDDSFGKFWQTVRARPAITLCFALPELESTIGVIRSRNADRGLYGGPGWANYAAAYFNDTCRFCRLLARLLRPRAAAIIVLGNSIIQGVEVKTDCIFGKIGELCGLKLEDRVLLRNKRTGTSIIQSSVRAGRAEERSVLYESAVVLRKTPYCPEG